MPINPKPNRYRNSVHAARQSAVLAASTRDGATEEAIRRAVGELHPAAGRWARAALDSPISATYTDADLATLEAAAIQYDGWLRTPVGARRAATFASFLRACDLLGCAGAGSRLRQHIEIEAPAPAPEYDEIEERRRLRAKFG